MRRRRELIEQGELREDGTTQRRDRRSAKRRATNKRIPADAKKRVEWEGEMRVSDETGGTVNSHEAGCEASGRGSPTGAMIWGRQA